jgi:hypothetical protein
MAGEYHWSPFPLRTRSDETIEFWFDFQLPHAQLFSYEQFLCHWGPSISCARSGSVPSDQKLYCCSFEYFLCHWGPYNPVSTQQVQIFWFWSNYGKYIVPMLILSSCWICNEAVAQVNQIFFRFYLCMRLPQEKCPTRPPWHRTISSSRTTFNGPYAWEDSSTQGGTNNNTKILYSPGKKDAHGWEYYF